jgi:transcriptional repressor of cell division inhibition gene dicB
MVSSPLAKYFQAVYCRAMRYTEAINHFGSEGELAAALGITRQAVNLWKAPDLVPKGTAYQLQVITAGRLRVEPKLYEKRESA